MGCVLGLPLVTQGGDQILDLVHTAIIQLPTLTVCVCELVAIVYIYDLCDSLRVWSVSLWSVYPTMVYVDIYGLCLDIYSLCLCLCSVYLTIYGLC